jgi:membrane protein
MRRPGREEVERWWGLLYRAGNRFLDHNLVDWGGALTFYLVLSLIPTVVILIALLGVIGSSVTQPVLENLSELSPGAPRTVVQDGVSELTSNRGTAGVALLIGLAATVWTASSYVGSFLRGVNVIAEVHERTPFWKRRPLQMGITVGLILGLAVCSLAVVITGPLARDVAHALGLDDLVDLWDLLKWPLVVVVVMVLFALLYWSAPPFRAHGFRLLTAGSIVAGLIWGLASAGFGIYVANFDSYNKTYGSLAGVVIFFVWLWLSNMALLYGAELNAELDRERAVAD